MIARLTLLLPFDIAIPDGEKFQLYTYEDEGYSITARPRCLTKCSLSNTPTDANGRHWLESN
jgi:hypothetical protein